MAGYLGHQEKPRCLRKSGGDWFRYFNSIYLISSETNFKRKELSSCNN